MALVDESDVLGEQSRKMDAVALLANSVVRDLGAAIEVIATHASTLRREGEKIAPPELSREAEAIDEATHQVTRTIEHLKVLSGQEDVSPQPVELNEFVRSLEPEVQARLPESVSVTWALTAKMGRVLIDARVVEQAILSLVDNAIEAMPDGGALTLKTLRRKPTRSGEEGMSVISVSDTGRGMKPEICLRAIEPFFTTKEPNEGSSMIGRGLGLSTAYARVVRSHGKLTIVSELGRGTTVELWLPRERLESPSHAPDRKAPKTAAVILLVESEESVRRAIARVLRSSGYEILEASNADEALVVLDSSGDDVDLLLTDVKMSGTMTGPELARRASEKIGPTRTLFMAGYVGDDVSRSELAEVGTALLKKPFTPDALLTRVRETLGARARYAIQVV